MLFALAFFLESESRVAFARETHDIESLLETPMQGKSQKHKLIYEYVVFIT